MTCISRLCFLLRRFLFVGRSRLVEEGRSALKGFQ